MSRRMVALLCLLLLLLTGCWDRIELEDMLFAVTVAIDKGEAERYRVTAQVAFFADKKSGVLGGREGGAPALELLVAEANSVAQAILIINTGLSRRLSLRHVRGFVIGEELAREGIEDLLVELERSPESRGTSTFAIARGSAGEVLRQGRWSGEYNPGRVAEGMQLVQKHLHLAPPTRLHHMVNRMGVIGATSFARVVAINPRVGAEDPELASGESAVAGELNRLTGNPVEGAGTAVFRQGRLVGFLTIDETQALLALRGEMGKAYVTIPNPFNPDRTILLRFQQENLPKYGPEMGPDGPRVQIRLIFEGEVLTGGENYQSEQLREAVEESARRHMEEQMRELLAKLKRWQVDPVGFGLLFRSRFPTWSAWEAYEWSEHLAELTVSATAQMRIRRHGLVLGGEQALEE